MNLGLKPLICNGFQPPNCPRRQFCAAVRFRSFVADGSWLHRLDNIFPDWSEDRKSFHTSNRVYVPFYEKALSPIPCPVAGPQPESICRSAIGKCFGRRCAHPSHRPTADNSHCRCCSTHVPAFEPGEIVGSLNEIILTFSFPFSRFAKKRAVCFRRRPPMEFIRLDLSSASSAPSVACRAPESTPGASSASPFLPIPPASAPAWGHQICR